MGKEEALPSWGKEEETLVSPVRGKWPSSTWKKEGTLFNPQGMRSEGNLSGFLGRKGALNIIVGVLISLLGKERTLLILLNPLLVKEFISNPQ
jgi:hypothetical protein